MDEQKTILLIDDEIDLQQLVKVVLNSKGYKIETADNGLDGLAKLEKGCRPDLIILDMNMPQMGGVEFYQKICDTWSQAKYPVLILTARSNMEEFFKALDVDGFMSKPFEIDELLKEVDRILAKRAGVVKTVKARDASQPIKVCVAENDTEACNKIGAAFLTAGYVVHLVRSGTETIEHVFSMVPEVAVVSFGLSDIPGNSVISKLKKMPKTQDVKFILYTEDTPEKAALAEAVSKQEGIDRFVKYQKVEDLILAVNEVLKPK